MNEVPASSKVAGVSFLRRKDLCAALLGCLAGPIALAVFATWRYGSVEAAVASAKGRTLFPDAAVKSLGDVEINKAAAVAFTLRNLTGHPIRLQGSQASCSCSVIEGLPCTIEPFATKSITASVSAGSKPEQLAGSFRVFTDDATEPELQLNYSARVISKRTDVVQ